jgi:heme A synthase
MFDRIMIPASVHRATGMLVLTATLAAVVVAIWLAWRKQERTAWANGVLIVAQLALMAQALVGIKLLDQGAGVLQLYIHYVGGLAPLLFFLVLYWFPLRDAGKQRWATLAATAGAFVFALMTFAIGQAFVRGAL